MTIARAAVLVVALATGAWFVLGIRQADDIQQASAIVTGTARENPALARHAATLLHAARTLDPDVQVDVLRGELALQQGDPAGARRILRDVVHREPSNVNAWIWLARSSQGDVQNFRVALAHVGRLLPRVPEP